ncbi:MAG: sulfatase-like hydrolase/transferase [Deltaproteobacteria bacterium]|nr:sulfatase-like hydrolase/transferase [Deltaproteobacteria bacterium]
MSLVLAAGCPREERPEATRQAAQEVRSPAATKTPRDILLVTLDTARADHFGHAGSDVATPNIDALAREGVAFLQAVAPTPTTLPSHSSLMTGRIPPQHGVRTNGTFKLGEEEETLAERLKAAGWKTGAFVAASVLDRKYGLDQGFDAYDDDVGIAGGSGLFQYPRRDGRVVVERALTWLGAQAETQPTFVWVHLFDAHAPYEAPEPERSRYPGRPYAAGIAYVDRVVGELVAGYRRLGRYDRAAMVITSDHGESLGEHGEATHSVFIYDATQRIPLVLRGPGLPGGRQVETQARLIDVMPTLLALAGLEVPARVRGRDLRGLIEGSDQEEPAYIESWVPRLQYGWHELTGLRTGGWKLISGSEDELYDLKGDPREKENLFSVQKEKGEKLRGLLGKLTRAPAGEEAALELDPGTREELGALGYIWVDMSQVQEKPDAPLLDPRVGIVIQGRMDRADGLYTAGRREQAFELYRAVLAENPANDFAARRFGDLLVLSRGCEEAVKVYDRLLARAGSEDARGALLNLGRCFRSSGSPDRAMRWIERAAEAFPDDREVRQERWLILRATGRDAVVAREARAAVGEDALDGAAQAEVALAILTEEGEAAMVAYLESALEKAPESTELHFLVATHFLKAGRLPEADAAYRKVLALKADHEGALISLGRMLLDANRIAEAHALLEVQEGSPLATAKVLAQLAEAKARSNRLEDAVPVAKRAVDIDPGSVEAWRALGSIQLNRGAVSEAIAAYERALALAPKDETTRANLATARKFAAGAKASGR